MAAHEGLSLRLYLERSESMSSTCLEGNGCNLESEVRVAGAGERKPTRLSATHPPFHRLLPVEDPDTLIFNIIFFMSSLSLLPNVIFSVFMERWEGEIERRQ